MSDDHLRHLQQFQKTLMGLDELEQVRVLFGVDCGTAARAKEFLEARLKEMTEHFNQVAQKAHKE